MRSRTASFHGKEEMDELGSTTPSFLARGVPTLPLSEPPSPQNGIGFRSPGSSAGPSDPTASNSPLAPLTPQTMQEGKPDKFHGNDARLPDSPRQVRGKALPTKPSPVKRTAARNSKKRGAAATRGGRNTIKPNLPASAPVLAKLAVDPKIEPKSTSDSQIQIQSAKTAQFDPQRMFDASPEEQPPEAQGWTSHLPVALEPPCDETGLTSRRTSARSVQTAPSTAAQPRVLNVLVGKRGRESDPPSPTQLSNDSDANDDQPMVAYVAPLPFHEAETNQ